MYAFTMKNAFNLYVEKEVCNAIEWTRLHSYMDSRSSFMPGMYQETSEKETSRMVVDVDSCFDRLYGGFDVDWKCGGDWTHMSNMLLDLRRCAETHNMQFVFIFNGTMPDVLREPEWTQQQLNARKNVFKIFRDPKCKEYRYWTTPPFLAEMLKAEIANINRRDSEDNYYHHHNKKNGPKKQFKAFECFTTIEDHQKEILRFCYLNTCRGLITSDYGLIALLAFEKYSVHKANANFMQLAVYLGRNLRFCENFGLTSFEVNVNNLLDRLRLSLHQFSSFTILTGLSCYVPDSYLMRFYEALIDKPKLVINTQIIAFKIIHEIAGFCKELTLPSDFSKIVITLSKGAEDRYLVEHCLINAIKRTQLSVRDDQGDYFDMEAHAKRNFQKKGKYGFPGVPRLDVKPNQNRNGPRSGSLPRTSLNTDSEASNRPTGYSQQWLETLRLNHIEGRSHPWIYHLLVRNRVYLPATFEPEICGNMLGVDELYKHLRAVGYAILFGAAFAGGSEQYTVTEVMFDTLKDRAHYETVRVAPKPQIGSFPRDPARTRQNRVDTFLKAIECPAHLRKIFDKLARPDHKIFVASLVLRYIVGYRLYLRSKDIRAFLATFFLSSRANNFQVIRTLFRDHESKLRFHPRPMHLANMFVRGMETLHFVDQVCGGELESAFYMPRVFHGTLFHLVYCLYDADEERLVGLTKEENRDLEEMYFSITCDLTASLIIDPNMSPYESRPATASFLYTPTSLNQSFFGGSLDSSISSDIFSPNKPVAEPSLLHMGCGRGILAFKTPKTVMRPGSYSMIKPSKPKKEPKPKKEEIAFLDYDHLFNFFYDHYSMINLYREREEEAMTREIIAKRPKTLRMTATQILAVIGIHETPEERREQLKKLKQEHLVNYLRKKLKPDANNKVKMSQLPAICFPFHRGVTKDMLKGRVEFTYRDETFPLCEHPQENLLVHGHTCIPAHIAFKRPI